MDFSAFSIEKPQYLVLVPLFLPLAVFFLVKFRKIDSFFHNSDDESFGEEDFYFARKKNLRSLKKIFCARIFFLFFAWIFMVLALCEISFGTKKIPVVKSGSNISLVFDISYSMLAEDAGKNLSRLDAAKIYAENLVENLQETSFSVILAKGNGFAAIPETEDKGAVFNLIENLSPKMMTSAGSSLSKGIEAALSGILEKSSKSHHIVLFTDCDETDNQLASSLEKACRLGVSVTILGFGRETESEILAGDGKNRVKTALRAQKTREIIENVEKSLLKSNLAGKKIAYLDAKEKGSAFKIINSVKKSQNEEKSVAWQAKPVKRHGLFIFFAILFLMASVLVKYGGGGARS